MQEENGGTATPVRTAPAATQHATPGATSAPVKPETSCAYPLVLLKPKARRAVMEHGQRPSRDDLAYPNVAAACSWMARAWNLALVTTALPDEPAVHGQLAELEVVLAALREEALRCRQLTFTQLLDDYLHGDEALRGLIRDAKPLARVTEFTLAARDIQAQWQDAPAANELHALKALLGHEAA